MDLAHLEEARQLVGAVDSPHLVHMVLEIAAYADDEAADQHRVGRVIVEIAEDRITVSDDGRGTDTRRDASGEIVRKPVMATPDIRFYGKDDAPLLPDGEPRRGMSVVAACSRQLVHENRRREGAWTQTYEYGIPASELVELDEWVGTGTSVHLRRLDTRVVAGMDRAALGVLLGGFDHVGASVRER